MARRKYINSGPLIPIETTSSLDKEFIAQIRAKRYKARTDLVWFCNKILNMKDISYEIHGPIWNKVLQKFPLPSLAEQEKLDIPYMVNGALTWQYQPYIPINSLVGPRRTMCFDPRGWMKTSFGIIAHGLQWIINYPDVAMAIIQGSQPKSRANLKEMKDHFLVNDEFRALFPEHVPPRDKINDFGNADEFTTLARSLSIRREPSVLCLAIESKVAGLHFDMLKFTDVVETENAQTPLMRDNIYNLLSAFNFILKQPISDWWLHIEGTVYHEDDAHMRIVKKHIEDKKYFALGEYPEDSPWVVFYRGCSKRKRPDNSPLLFEPEEMYFDKALDSEGDPVSNWPDKFNKHVLRKIARALNNPETYACQMELAPHDYKDSSKPFNSIDMEFITPKEWITLVESGQIVGFKMTIDTAEEKHTDSKYSVITVAGWSKSGNCYIIAMERGKWHADELIENIFRIARLYKPFLTRLEKVPYVNGLMASITYKQQADPKHYPDINIKLEPRSNKIVKDQRILSCLQPFWRAKKLIFLDSLATMDAIKQELNTFPKGSYKDILDTLADQFLDETFIDSSYDPNDINKLLAMPISQEQRLAAERKFFKMETIEELTEEQEDDFRGNYIISPDSCYDLPVFRD